MPGGIGYSTNRVCQSGTSLTVATTLESVWPIAIADDVLGKTRASLEFGLQQVAFVKEQDKGGICQ